MLKENETVYTFLCSSLLCGAFFLAALGCIPPPFYIGSILVRILRVNLVFSFSVLAVFLLRFKGDVKCRASEGTFLRRRQLLLQK